MIIKSADFTVSNTRISKLPPPILPEYAFIGRSNVGKSSLINMIVNVKGLAKTSQKPGKTQLINHFLINKEWYIVDLPGYGYAKSSKSNRAEWAKFIRFYLEKRESLQTFIIPFFRKFGFLSNKKKKEFRIFREALDVLEHKIQTQQDLEKFLTLRAQLNELRTTRVTNTDAVILETFVFVEESSETIR